MKSADEFVRRFRVPMVGLAMCGYASEVKDGPTVRASRLIDLPEDMEKLLRQMHAFIMTDEKAK